MPDNQTNQSPWDTQLDVEKHLASIYDEVTGMKSTIEIVRDENGKPVVDAAGLPQITVVSEPDPNGHPLCNLEGGRMLVHHIRLQMNRHNTFADLDRDEIADITSNAIMQPIDTMMFNLEQYGITDLSRLETEGLSLWDSLYVYLSQLKTGALGKTWGGILTVQYQQRDGQIQQQGQATGSLYSGLPKLGR